MGFVLSRVISIREKDRWYRKREKERKQIGERERSGSIEREIGGINWEEFGEKKAARKERVGERRDWRKSGRMG